MWKQRLKYAVTGVHAPSIDAVIDGGGSRREARNGVGHETCLVSSGGI